MYAELSVTIIPGPYPCSRLMCILRAKSQKYPPPRRNTFEMSKKKYRNAVKLFFLNILNWRVKLNGWYVFLKKTGKIIRNTSICHVLDGYWLYATPDDWFSLLKCDNTVGVRFLNNSISVCGRSLLNRSLAPNGPIRHLSLYFWFNCYLILEEKYNCVLICVFVLFTLVYTHTDKQHDIVVVGWIC